MVATNAAVASSASGSTAVGSRPLGQTRTDLASPVSLALSSSLTTTTWSNCPIVRRSIRSRAAASPRSRAAGTPRRAWA